MIFMYLNISPDAWAWLVGLSIGSALLAGIFGWLFFELFAQKRFSVTLGILTFCLFSSVSILGLQALHPIGKTLSA